jgi:predicted dehydrogenase
MVQVRWGILGPGGIARRFFRSAIGSSTGRIVALGTRNPGSGNLATDFPETRIHASYDALVSDPDVDAIYIATPHPFHAEWAIRAAKAGKHVLCEKPMAMSAAQTEAIFEAARRHGVFMGEAFMYRHHPLTRFILDYIDSGKLGQVCLIKSSFGFALPDPDPNHRLLSQDLGGGAILDVGGYTVSIARLLAGHQATGRSADPISFAAVGTIGPTGVDTLATALLGFPNDVVAEISGSILLAQDNVLHVIGTQGRLEIDQFWFGTGVEGGTKTVRFYGEEGAEKRIAVTEEHYLYSFQFEAANDAILNNRASFSYPGMDANDTLGNARVLDMWLDAVHGQT